MGHADIMCRIAFYFIQSKANWWLTFHEMLPSFSMNFWWFLFIYGPDAVGSDGYRTSFHFIPFSFLFLRLFVVLSVFALFSYICFFLCFETFPFYFPMLLMTFDSDVKLPPSVIDGLPPTNNWRNCTRTRQYSQDSTKILVIGLKYWSF